MFESKFNLQASIMRQAAQWATMRSKDPSSKVGAAIYDPCSGGLFMGYNGFPSGIPDSEVWWESRNQKKHAMCKYDLVIHAEVNAVNKALKAGVNLSECELYCTHLPCPSCMKDVILLNKIKTVYFTTDQYKSLTPRAMWVVRQLAAMTSTSLIQITADDRTVTLNQDT